MTLLFIFYLFNYFGRVCSMWKFLGQGSDPRHSRPKALQRPCWILSLLCHKNTSLIYIQKCVFFNSMTWIKTFKIPADMEGGLISLNLKKMSSGCTWSEPVHSCPHLWNWCGRCGFSKLPTSSSTAICSDLFNSPFW